MKKYAVGLDFGTNSCRSLVVDLADGQELANHVFSCPSGQDGILLDPSDPNVARQNPADYSMGLIESIRGAIKQARKNVAGFNPASVIGIGIDTTGSSPMPVDRNGTPLGLLPDFKNNLNAMVWLWKDHSSYAEAAQITSIAKKIRPEKIKRSVCAAGHKAMYNDTWGGLPDKEFLSAMDPVLADLRDRLYENAVPSDHLAGHLSPDWAEKLSLKPGIAIAVGAVDAHMGAVGAGVKEGTLVKILGTSTCDIMVSPKHKGFEDIPGVCGIVDGSVLPGYFGIEAGQSAVGDIFMWFVSNLIPASYGKTADEIFRRLETETSKQKPGEHGLLCLDWNNGNRNTLVDVRLSGLILGQTLHTKAHEIYRALIESTAFGALTIIDRIEEYGVTVKDIVTCGGLARKNPFMMQIYADIIGRPMKVSRSDQAPALGAAIYRSCGSST